MNIEDEIRKKVQELIEMNDAPARNQYMMIEKLIETIMSKYIQEKGGNVESDYIDSRRRIRYDMFVPEGFDNYKGDTAIEIKWYRYGPAYMRVIYDTIRRISVRGRQIQNLIIILVGEVPQIYKDRIQREQQNINFNIYVWDIEDLINIFSKYLDLFNETYENLREVYIKKVVTKAISTNRLSYIEKRSEFIEDLQYKYNEDDVVLFLGAGASADAGIASWDDLISELFVALIDTELTIYGIELERGMRTKLAKEVKQQNQNSPLLQTRFIRQGLENQFEDIVRSVLYRKELRTSDLLKQIGNLCIPNRGKIGIRAIINYNFDDLIEKNLEYLKLKYRTVYRNGVIPGNDEIGIYHVHGFLPKEKDGYENLAKSLLVFSEEGYHKLMLEPYNWANIIQLNYLMNNTCLFIGLSMTDPNLRRLLDIAAQKEIDEKCRHYAIMKRLKFKKSEDEKIKKFEQINEELQESLFKELGVNIIWIDDYDEIPNILKKIKNSKVDPLSRTQ